MTGNFFATKVKLDQYFIKNWSKTSRLAGKFTVNAIAV